MILKLREVRQDQIAAIQRLRDETEKALAKDMLGTQRAAFRTYDDRLRVLIQKLKDLHDVYFRGGDAGLAMAKQYRLDQQAERIIMQEMSDLNDKITDIYKDAIVRQFQRSLARSTWELDSVTPPNIVPKFARPNEQSIAEMVLTTWRGNLFSQEIGLINDESARMIQNEFEKAMVNGDSAYDLGRRIRSFVGIGEDERLATRPLAGRAKWRADMIARTQMMQAANAGQKVTYEENKEIISTRKWITRSPGQFKRGKRRLCDYCEERRNKTEDEVREIAKEQGLPLEPPIHPMCACIWIVEPKPWSELMTKELALKVKYSASDHTLSFEDWRAKYGY